MANDDNLLIRKFAKDPKEIDGFEARNIREADMDRKYNKEMVRLLKPRCAIGVWGIGENMTQAEWDNIFKKGKSKMEELPDV